MRITLTIEDTLYVKAAAALPQGTPPEAVLREALRTLVRVYEARRWDDTGTLQASGDQGTQAQSLN